MSNITKERLILGITETAYFRTSALATLQKAGIPVEINTSRMTQSVWFDRFTCAINSPNEDRSNSCLQVRIMSTQEITRTVKDGLTDLGLIPGEGIVSPNIADI